MRSYRLRDNGVRTVLYADFTEDNCDCSEPNVLLTSAADSAMASAYIRSADSHSMHSSMRTIQMMCARCQEDRTIFPLNVEIRFHTPL